MKISIKLAALSLIALSACGSDEIPYSAELPRRAPVLNSSPIDQDINVVSGGYIAAEIPSSIPAPFPSQEVPSAFPPIGGGFQAPEPPVFSGSQLATPQSFPQDFSTSQPLAPQMPNYSASLPIASPVDVSAAEMSAANLPVQRRAPAFNQQSLGVTPENSVKMLPVQAPMAQLQPMIMDPIPTAPVIQSPTINQVVPQIAVQEPAAIAVEAPQIAYADNDGFPRLSQIPSAQINAPRIDVDPRAQQLRNDLNAVAQVEISEPATDFAALRPLPNEPLYKIPEAEPQFVAAQPEIALPPMPPAEIVQPEYAPAPAYAPAPIFSPAPAHTPPVNYTELSNLRPIGSTGAQPSLRTSRNYKNVGVARHSTRGGY